MKKARKELLAGWRSKTKLTVTAQAHRPAQLAIVKQQVSADLGRKKARLGTGHKVLKCSVNPNGLITGLS
jgi:hypothetical protein